MKYQCYNCNHVFKEHEAEKAIESVPYEFQGECGVHQRVILVCPKCSSPEVSDYVEIQIQEA